MVTDYSEASDHQLIADFKDGSMDAMDKIVERYETRLFTFGRKMCGNIQDAEDIVQETFLSAFRYLNSFREETKLINWLFKIAARACMKKRRKKKCEPDGHLSLDSFYTEEGGNSTYEIPDWSNDPSDNVLRSELGQIIDKAMQSLPPNYRIIFNLRDIQGFNTEETSEILDISIASVKTGLHRARLFMRDKISSLYKEAKIA
ncbi:RNA polymerase sigma factor [Thermodesulfobacteriota bacterium]